MREISKSSYKIRSTLRNTESDKKYKEELLYFKFSNLKASMLKVK